MNPSSRATPSLRVSFFPAEVPAKLYTHNPNNLYTIGGLTEDIAPYGVVLPPTPQNWYNITETCPISRSLSYLR